VEDADVIAAHLHHLTLRGLSENTKINRRSQLARLSAFLSDKRLLDATKDDLLEWASSLAAAGKTARTRYAEISIVHAFYVWAHDQELIEVVPSLRLPRPKLPKAIPHPMSRPNLDRALVGAPPHIRCWSVLAAYAGLRCCEIAPLTRGQIMDSLDQPMLMVHGKGNKDRLVPLSPRVMDELRLFGLPSRGYLFAGLTRSGRPPTANRVSQLLNRWLHESGIPDTAHSIRHMFATDIQRITGDLQTTQHLLGHANVSTTTMYAAFDNARAVSAVLALGDAKPAVGITPAVSGPPDITAALDAAACPA
jgi:site-specific recombinase XerD